MKNLLKLIPILSTFVPLIAFAQFFGNICFGFSGLNFLLCRTNQLFASVLPVLVALGVVYFVWGVVYYFIKDDEEAKKKGRDRIIFGIIGLAVIISVWGLVYILADTFATGDYSAPSGLQNLLPQ